MNIAAYTGGKHNPSSRFRVGQYISLLRDFGCKVSHFDAPFGAFPPPERWKRPWWGLASLTSRVPQIALSYRHDLVWMQREMLSTFYTLERFTQKPRVFDVDDAIWVHRRGQFAGRLANQCDSIICGNQFLAEYFSRWNPHVTIIPTGVDVDRFVPANAPEKGNRLILGWSGTSSNFVHLELIQDALDIVLRRNPHVIFRIVADRCPALHKLPPEQVEIIRWSPQNEVETIQAMDVGLMPLGDSDITRGKCSYKMLLYMACGLPVVVSPVGMNKEVLGLGAVGFGPNSIASWRESLECLIQQSALRSAMGVQGRSVAVSHFGLAKVASELAFHFRQFS